MPERAAGQKAAGAGNAASPSGPSAGAASPAGAAPTPAAPAGAAAFAHATAVIDAGAVLEPGVKAWHCVHVCAGARVGEGSSLGQNVYVGPGVSIGRRCKVQNNVSVYEGVTLEDEVFVGPSAVFTNVRNPRAHVSRRHEFGMTIVRRRATIGANSTIVCGVTIGVGAFVAAGAVVTKDVAPYTLMKGVPARPSGFVCGCGEVFRGASPRSKVLRCGSCGTTYVRATGGGLALEGTSPDV